MAGPHSLAREDAWKSYTLINVLSATIKVSGRMGGLGKTLGRSGHLCWVLENKEELAKLGRAPQAEGPVQAEAWRCEHTWHVQEPSSSLLGKSSKPGRESWGQAVKDFECHPWAFGVYPTCGGHTGRGEGGK